MIEYVTENLFEEDDDPIVLSFVGKKKLLF